MDASHIITSWAESRNLPLQGEETSNADRVVLLVLNGEKIPGEMDIAGQITVLQLREDPKSFAIETCCGNMILDESWAGEKSLPSILDSALRILQQRVKSPLAQWALAIIEPKSQSPRPEAQASATGVPDTSIDKTQLAIHDGIFFAIWHEEWESSHPEDTSERIRFTFEENHARQEFHRLKERMGQDPDVIRESLGWFRLVLPQPHWDSLPEGSAWIDGSYLHPVKSLRKSSAVGDHLQVQVMETGGAAIATLWSQIVK